MNNAELIATIDKCYDEYGGPETHGIPFGEALLAALDAAGKCIVPKKPTEATNWFKFTADIRILDPCATEDCDGQVTHRMEAGNVGAFYCSECHAKITARASIAAQKDG